MKFLTTIVFIFAFIANAEPAKLMGYYPDWGKWMTPKYTVDKIPYEKLTHILWSFVSPNADGSLRGDAVDSPSDLDSMVSLAHKANTKVILSLGGAGLCENFAAVSASESLRAIFINNLISFVNAHHLDGLDLDWEYSSVPVPAADTSAYTKLVHDLRAALPKDKSLSAAIPCSPYYGKYFSVEGFIDDLDWIGFMTYDITGSWDDLARFNSPLYPNPPNTTWSWEETATYWSGRNIDASKMVFGFASFGFDFGAATGPASSFNSNDVTYTSFAEVSKNPSWIIYFDSIAKVPYGISENRFVTFDNPESAAAKAEFVKENHYAGIMIWEISLDYIENEPQKNIEALASSLFGTSNAMIMQPIEKTPWLSYKNGLFMTNSNKHDFEVQIKTVNGKTIESFTLKTGKSVSLKKIPAGNYIAVSKYGRLNLSIGTQIFE